MLGKNNQRDKRNKLIEDEIYQCAGMIRSFLFMLRSVWKQLQGLSHNTASVDSSADIKFAERCHYVINCFRELLNECVPDVSESKSGI